MNKARMKPKIFINDKGELVKRIGVTNFEIDCVLYSKRKGFFFALSNSAFKNKK
jgi:hypothetical protein